MDRAPVVLRPGEGRRYDMGRLSAVFKADGDESSGMYSVSEWWLDPHTKGPPSHHHRDDDLLFVLGGTISVLVDGSWLDAEAGSFVLIPGGMPHTFENRTDRRAGFLSISAPGGFEEKMPGIAQWFIDRPESDSTA